MIQKTRASSVLGLITFTEKRRGRERFFTYYTHALPSTSCPRVADGGGASARASPPCRADLRGFSSFPSPPKKN